MSNTIPQVISIDCLPPIEKRGFTYVITDCNGNSVDFPPASKLLRYIPGGNRLERWKDYRFLAVGYFDEKTNPLHRWYFVMFSVVYPHPDAIGRTGLIHPSAIISKEPESLREVIDTDKNNISTLFPCLKELNQSQQSGSNLSLLTGRDEVVAMELVKRLRTSKLDGSNRRLLLMQDPGTKTWTTDYSEQLLWTAFNHYYDFVGCSYNPINENTFDWSVIPFSATVFFNKGYVSDREYKRHLLS